MSSPPQTPTNRPQSSHRRHPSSLDLSYNDYNSSPRYSFSHSRRTSLNLYSPVTPRSSHGFAEHPSPGFHDSSDLHDMNEGGGGLGNLADELAEAWSEDEMEEGDDNGLPPGSELVEANGHADGLPNGHMHGNGVLEGTRDSGVALNSSPTTHQSSSTLSPPKVSRRGHRRKESVYDGSDYGDDSDLEASEGISRGLEARMADVESLARRGTEANGTEADGIVARVTEQLRDLGSQTGVEGGTTRLTTAHTALTTHLTHTTRQLQSLTSTLLSPVAPPPPAELIDLLLPAIESTLELIPRTTPQPLLGLHALSSHTADLTASLSYLSDTLHMSRQTSNAAGRRLRVVTEALAEWKRERERGEEGRRWIERGGWDQKLQQREAARICEGVVGGFEKYCDGLRGRLADGVDVAAA